MNFGIRDRPNANMSSVPDQAGDVMPINYDTAWKVGGPDAPSSIDLNPRPEVLDLMGIERELVHQTFGLMALVLLRKPDAHKFLGLDPDALDAQRLGTEGIHAHNRSAVEITKTTSERARPVGMVLAESVDGMIRQTEQVLADGIRAPMLAANSAPDGTTPAAPALDPFWRMAADANGRVTSFHFEPIDKYLKRQSRARRSCATISYTGTTNCCFPNESPSLTSHSRGTYKRNLRR